MNNKSKNLSTALKGRRLSSEHRAAISAGAKGSQSKCSSMARAQRCQQHPPRALEWLLIDPQGVLIKTDRLQQYCDEHNLAYSILRQRAQQRDCSPVTRGPSAGWVVFGVRKKSQIKIQ